MKLELQSGSKMHYSDSQKDSEHVFICVHGGGADRSHLYPQYECLSKSFRVISVDLAGYGESETTAVVTRIERYIVDLKDLIDHCQIKEKKIVFIGHSMGGMIACEFAATHPSMVAGLILISAGIILPDKAKIDSQAFLEKLSGSEFELALEDLVDQLLPYKQNRKCADLVRDTFFKVSKKQWVAAFSIMMEWDKRAKERLSKCRCPMLYIEDGGGRYSDLDSVKEACPQLVCGKVVCSGHFPTIEVPDQVNAMIERFFKVAIAR